MTILVFLAGVLVGAAGAAGVVVALSWLLTREDRTADMRRCPREDWPA